MGKGTQKEALTQQLIHILAGGLDLSRDVCHFIDSTLAPASAREFEQLLAAADNCEAEAVTELIFFPDQALQEQLEPAIEAAGCTEKDVSGIQEALCRAGIDAPIRFPDHRGEARIRLSEPVAQQLLARLNLTVRIAPEIARTIDQRLPDPELAHRVRVRLRNARIGQSKNQIDFLSSLIQRFPGDTGEFLETLDLAIYLLEQIKGQDDIYKALMAHKKMLMQAIRASEKNREALAANTVEALIMKGIPISSICAESARQTIDRIDRLSFLIYGQTESFPLPDTVRQTVDLAAGDNGDIGAIMRLLNC